MLCFLSHSLVPSSAPHRPRAALVAYMIRFALIPASLALAIALARQASRSMESQRGNNTAHPFAIQIHVIGVQRT